MTSATPIEEQIRALMRGVEYGDANIARTMEEDLRERLSLGRPLRVYCGFDPTSTDLTLGNLVPMLKLRQFQRLGHDVTFLIGTMTATIGDPSDKAAARQMLTPEQVEANAQTWLRQAYRVLDPQKTTIARNGDWLPALNLADVVHIASNFTVAQFLDHETFRKRMDEGKPLYIHEFIYALMQAYDAHHLQTDVQLGGIDQLFNIMAGRQLQRALGERPLIAVTTPLLIGTDGALKMSKSVGNYVGLDEPPAEMYGKLMSIPDSLMLNYFTLLTEVPPEELAAIERGLAQRTLHPMATKKRLAHAVVALLYTTEDADSAAEGFRITFETRTPLPTPNAITVDLIPLPAGTVEARVAGPWHGNFKVASLPQLLVDQGMAISLSQARALIRQRAVREVGSARDNGLYARHPDKPLTATTITLEKGMILRVGPHRFIHIMQA